MGPQVLLIEPLPDEDQDAGPGPGLNDRVLQPARAELAAGAGGLLRGLEMLPVGVGGANPVQADRRGDHIGRMAQLEMAGLPAIQQILDRERRVVPRIGIELLSHEGFPWVAGRKPGPESRIAE